MLVILLVSARARFTRASVSGVDFWKNVRIFSTLDRIREHEIGPLFAARAAESH